MTRIQIFIPTFLFFLPLFLVSRLYCQNNSGSPNQLDLIVNLQIIPPRDSKGLFSYSYGIKSTLQSKQEVDDFGVVTNEKVTGIFSPKGWDYSDTTVSHPNTPKFGHWIAVGFGDEVIENEDPSQVYPSPFNIKPGGSLGGFQFSQNGPPGAVKYFAVGFVPLSAYGESDESESEYGDYWGSVYWGQTVGPVKVDDPSLKGLIPRLKELLGKARELKWVDAKLFPKFVAPLELILSFFAKNGNSIELIQSFQDYLKLFEKLKASLDPNFYVLMVPNLEFILIKIKEESK